MIALALAALIQTAPAVPSPTPGTPAPLPSIQVIPPGVPTPAPSVPIAPPSRPSGIPVVTDPDLAAIVDGGSTNSAGYTILVRRNGWITATSGVTTIHRRIDRTLATQLFADLRAAQPFATLPARMCVKSASFGTTRVIAYRGAHTPDLTCPTTDARIRALEGDAVAIATAAGLGDRSAPRRAL